MEQTGLKTAIINLDWIRMEERLLKSIKQSDRDVLFCKNVQYFYKIDHSNFDLFDIFSEIQKTFAQKHKTT